MAPLRGEDVMIVMLFDRFAAASAIGTVALRGGIVAVNFIVMMGLAALLGLDAFGVLAVNWGLAMIASTALSCGAPLLLLRHLTDGQGMSIRSIIVQVVAFPICLTTVAFFILQVAFPTVDWLAVLLVGLAIHLVTCLASIMRALGSVQASMVLRDAGPQVALGAAGVIMIGSPASMILLHAALWLGLICFVAAIWCIRHQRWADIFQPKAPRFGLAWSLWGTALLGMTLAQIDIVVGGSILSPEQIGLYAVLRRLANLVALPVSVATWVSAASVSAAFGSGDRRGLREASARGSQIAFIPGTVLFCGLLMALPLADFALGQRIVAEARWTFIVLASGAFLQVVFASSFTVATLCGEAHMAAISRALSAGLYLLIIVGFGQSVGVLGHACIYVAAVSAGTILLWQLVRRRLDVDTSVAILWRRSGVAWKLS